jgi:uncharacterized protein DUF4129
MIQDSLRAVLDSVFAAPEYHWVERRHPLAFVARWLEGLQRWLSALRDAHPLGFRLLLAGLVIVLVASLVHAGWILSQAIRVGEATRGPGAPVAIRKDRAWYGAEADRLAASGQYREAMQAEFLALVLALESRALLRFAPSKTPAEYARDARLGPQARSDFRALVTALYGYAFARWPCGPEEFARWRAQAAPERYARA